MTKFIVSERTTWVTIELLLKKPIDVVCAAKEVIDPVIDFFCNTANKRLRRRRRLFNQGKKGKRLHRFRMKWDIANWIKSAGETLSTAAKSVVEGKNNVYSTVKSKISSAADWVGGQLGTVSNTIKDMLKKVFEAVLNLFEKVRLKLVAFFNGNLMKNIIEFIKCLRIFKEALNKYRK